MNFNIDNILDFIQDPKNVGLDNGMSYLRVVKDKTFMIYLVFKRLGV